MVAGRALFGAYPALREALPHFAVAELPTPVEEVAALGTSMGAGRLFVKRDDLTATAYGGNKVRKLEFLLPSAKERGAKEVMTFGYAGSNHCTATAIHARSVGLRSISMLTPQLPTAYLRRNLLASFAAGAELNLYRSARSVRLFAPFVVWQHRRRMGTPPYLIPPGGSSALGTIGFVNAAFELKAQVDAGLLPEPDALYVAFSSMGTVAGLTLGLQAAGLRTRVVAVQVVDEGAASKEAAGRLAQKAYGLLRGIEADFPAVDLTLPNLEVRNEFFGGKYAKFTPEGIEMLERFKAALRLDEELALDGTYSGKALAGLAADGKAGKLAGRTVLFWNTFNSRPFWKTMDLPEYKELPREFWKYFETTDVS